MGETKDRPRGDDFGGSYEAISAPEQNTSRKFKLVFLLMLIVVAVLIVAAVIAKTVLANQAMKSQSDYERVCGFFGGEVKISETYDGMLLDCVSTMFSTMDGMRLCNSQEECEGVCVGDFTARVDYHGSCSDGVRVLPAFLVPVRH
ncbi:MAG: hypothetical protein V1738_04350 [Patescibacteria group bacterium]